MMQFGFFSCLLCVFVFEGTFERPTKKVTHSLKHAYGCNTCRVCTQYCKQLKKDNDSLMFLFCWYFKHKTALGKVSKTKKKVFKSRFETPLLPMKC